MYEELNDKDNKKENNVVEEEETNPGMAFTETILGVAGIYEY